jgi:hypothetical protein
MTAHQAVAAVAGHQIAGAQPLFSLGTGQRQADPFPILAERLQVAGEQHPDLVEAGQAVVQHLVRQGLDKGVAARPAKLVGVGLDVGEATPLGSEKAHGVHGRGVRQHLLGEIHRLEGTQAFVVQPDGAGKVDQGIQFFHHHDLDTAVPQVVGDHQSDRAGAGNHHVGVETGMAALGCMGCCCHVLHS